MVVRSLMQVADLKQPERFRLLGVVLTTLLTELHFDAVQRIVGANIMSPCDSCPADLLIDSNLKRKTEVPCMFAPQPRGSSLHASKAGPNDLVNVQPYAGLAENAACGRTIQPVTSQGWACLQDSNGKWSGVVCMKLSEARSSCCTPQPSNDAHSSCVPSV